MNFELKKTWDLEKRLATWNRNESKFNLKNNKTSGSFKQEVINLINKQK